jgi:hypothetical protein
MSNVEIHLQRVSFRCRSMTTNYEKLAKGKAVLIRRAYAIKYDRSPNQKDTITGGPITIQGQKRFVPLSIRKAKPRHCRSCSYYHNCWPCKKGLFSSPTTEACEEFRDRNWKKRGMETN